MISGSEVKLHVNVVPRDWKKWEHIPCCDRKSHGLGHMLGKECGEKRGWLQVVEM